MTSQTVSTMYSFCTPTWSRPYWRDDTCYMCTSAAENRQNLLLFLPLPSLEGSYLKLRDWKAPMWKHSWTSLGMNPQESSRQIPPHSGPLYSPTISTDTRSFVRDAFSSARHLSLLWSYLFCLSTSLVLLAHFVWLISECDPLPIVPLSELHTLWSLPLSNSHEVMS